VDFNGKAYKRKQLFEGERISKNHAAFDGCGRNFTLSPKLSQDSDALYARSAYSHAAFLRVQSLMHARRSKVVCSRENCSCRVERIEVKYDFMEDLRDYVAMLIVSRGGSGI
jgi:hypothetical protein